LLLNKAASFDNFWRKSKQQPSLGDSMPDRKQLAQGLRQPRPSLPADLAQGLRGPLGFIAQDPGSFAKGIGVAPFTAAPDLLGIATQTMNQLAKLGQSTVGLPEQDIFKPISGDPIRELAGLDPKSPQGLFGEIASPQGTVAKIAGATAKSLAAGAKLAANSDFPTGLAMTLFHGTPHKFEKFELEKIGTGEGFQAFGHGLYFAENPKVAHSYRQALATPNFKITTPTGNTYMTAGDGRGLNTIGSGIDAQHFEILENITENLQASGVDATVDTVQDALDAFARIEHSTANPGVIVKGPTPKEQTILDKLDIKSQRGFMYEVDIPDEVIDNMLDYDKPLKEQPEVLAKLKQRFPSMFTKRPTNLEHPRTGEISQMTFAPRLTENTKGKDAYREFVELNRSLSPNPEERASRELSAIGIRGIKFLDQVSRRPVSAIDALKKPTRNIVLFDPDSIRSVKRDGELVFRK
jgi:hypothetical protein